MMAHLANGYLVTETEWNAMDDRIATLETIDTGVHYTYKDSVPLTKTSNGIYSVTFPTNLGIPVSGVIHCTAWNGDTTNVPFFAVAMYTLTATGFQVYCFNASGEPYTFSNIRINYTIAW